MTGLQSFRIDREGLTQPYFQKSATAEGSTSNPSRAAVAKIFPDVFDKVTVIAYTKEIPNDTVSVRKGLSADLKMRIREGLKKVSRSPQGSKVLKKLYGISGFTDLDGLFDPVREAGRLLNLNLGDLKP